MTCLFHLLICSQEAEQSEFERAEKERERVRAHESVIEREIREQQERERELHSRYQRGPASPRSPAVTSHEAPRATPSSSATATEL